MGPALSASCHCTLRPEGCLLYWRALKKRYQDCATESGSLQLPFLSGLKSEGCGKTCPCPAARMSLLASRPVLTHSSSLSLSRFALTLKAVIVMPAALARFWRCTFCFSSSAL